MTALKQTGRIFIWVLAAHFVLYFLTFSNHSSSDGYLRVGYPFTVYIDSDGKMADGRHPGFDARGILLNLLVVIFVSLLIALLGRKKETGRPRYRLVRKAALHIIFFIHFLFV